MKKFDQDRDSYVNKGHTLEQWEVYEQSVSLKVLACRVRLETQPQPDSLLHSLPFLPFTTKLSRHSWQFRYKKIVEGKLEAFARERDHLRVAQSLCLARIPQQSIPESRQIAGYPRQ